MADCTDGDICTPRKGKIAPLTVMKELINAGDIEGGANEAISDSLRKLSAATEESLTVRLQEKGGLPLILRVKNFLLLYEIKEGAYLHWGPHPELSNCQSGLNGDIIRSQHLHALPL